MANFLFAIVERCCYLLRLRRYKQILVEVGAFQKGHFERKCLGGRGLAPNHCWYQKTRVFLLPYSEDRMVLPSFVWIGYQRVTDGRTDTLNCCRYYSALHCKQCVCAVKSGSGLGLGELPKILGSPIIFLQRLGLATLNLARIWGLPRPFI